VGGVKEIGETGKEDRGKIVDLRFEIADLSFGLPPFGRVPSFGLLIFQAKKARKDS
jgi:hypothetical protein